MNSCKRMIKREHQKPPKLSVQQILARAEAIAAERKTWTRAQHVERLLKVADELRQEAIAKGVVTE